MAQFRTCVWRGVMLALLPVAALAGVNGAGEAGLDGQMAEPSAPARSAGGEGIKGHSLRCWQYGRLIFEESIAAVPVDLAAQAVVLRTGKDAKPVYLFDMKGSTCMVK